MTIMMTYISHIEIPNIGYVQIDTNIVSLSSIQPMMNKGSHLLPRFSRSSFEVK